MRAERADRAGARRLEIAGPGGDGLEAPGRLHGALPCRRTRRLALAGAGMLLAGLSGCAGLAASRAAEARLAKALDSARCERTLDEAWAEARRLLAERGYPLSGADAQATGRTPGFLERPGILGRLLSPARETHDEGARRVLETGWLQSRRYRLAGAQDAPGCHVAFLAIREDQSEHARDALEPPRRDLQLELELLRRLAPDEAARVEAATPAAAPAGAG